MLQWELKGWRKAKGALQGILQGSDDGAGKYGYAILYQLADLIIGQNLYPLGATHRGAGVNERGRKGIRHEFLEGTQVFGKSGAERERCFDLEGGRRCCSRIMSISKPLESP